MNRSLERRIEKLERGSHLGTEVESANAIFHSYEMVRNHPEEATDEDRALVAVTSHDDWQRALVDSHRRHGRTGSYGTSVMRVISPPECHVIARRDWCRHTGPKPSNGGKRRSP